MAAYIKKESMSTFFFTSK